MSDPRTDGTRWCLDDRHGSPCKLPCVACEADECDATEARTYEEMNEAERTWFEREVAMGNIPAQLAPVRR